LKRLFDIVYKTLCRVASRRCT